LQELAKVFKTDVNGLPLSLDISWFEQKAVAVLLTLLHLGVKNIRWAGLQDYACVVAEGYQ
jgi:hydroxylamine reductase (hybrid-cluster protein)